MPLELLSLPHLIELPTASGEIIRFSLIKSGQFDYLTIYQTTNCSNCPFFIPTSAIQPYLQMIADLNPRAKISLPKSPIGVCTYSVGLWPGLPLKKLLIENPHNPISGCHLSEAKRTTRADHYRSQDTLI